MDVLHVDLRNSPIVKVILHRNDFTQESQRAKDKKRVSRTHQNKDSSQQILADDAILYVIAVMLNAK